MVTVRLEGIHKVRVQLKSGPMVYYYAWRGGPRLTGAPGSPEFVRAYHDAHASRKAVPDGSLRSLIAKFKASPQYAKLGAHSKRAYKRHLDDIETRFGSMSLAVLEDPQVRKSFMRWRDELSATPRTADYAIATLKRVLSWAVERVEITVNHAEPISRLHRADRADSIWTTGELAAFRKVASAELQWAVDLALHTGLRQSDLIRLAWNHRDGQAFTFRTSKRNRVVTIPITPDCETVLASIAKRGPVILTTHRGKTPWTADGLRSSFAEACKQSGVSRTFHDLRRTAATRLVSAGLDSGQVASIMGWSEGDVEAMKRKYVSRSAVVSAALAKLEKGV